MRPVSLFIMAMVLTGAAVAPAFALQATDTMRSWKGASAEERAALLEAILGKEIAGIANVTRCMNETSTLPGHSDLPIGEVAKACGSPANAGEPV